MVFPVSFYLGLAFFLLNFPHKISGSTLQFCYFLTLELKVGMCGYCTLLTDFFQQIVDLSILLV